MQEGKKNPLIAFKLLIVGNDQRSRLDKNKKSDVEPDKDGDYPEKARD